MKIKIVNNTDLSFKLIGLIIDKYIDDSDPGETIYYGKVDWFTFEALDKKYMCQVRYMKNYTQYLIEEICRLFRSDNDVRE